MNYKKFTFLFVVWHCANTVNGSPISFESELKCDGDNCTTTTEDLIRIEDRRKIHDPTLTKPDAPDRRKRQVNNAKTDTATTKEETSSPNPVEVVAAELPVVLEPPKNEVDLTNSAEYKKAQENLLSATERVTDSKISSDAGSSPLDDKLSLNAETQPDVSNQIATVSTQPQTHSSDTISSVLDNPKLLSDGDELKTENLKESTKIESVPVEQDNVVGSDFLLTAKSAPTPEESTEPKLKTVDPTEVTTATEDGNAKDDSSSNKPQNPTEESMEPKTSDKPQVESAVDVSVDKLIPKEDTPGSTVDAVKANTPETDNSDVKLNAENKSADKVPMETKEPVTSDEGSIIALSDPVSILKVPEISAVSDIVSKPNDSEVKVPMGEKSTQDTTRKLDPEAEPKALDDHLEKENVADPISTQKSSPSADMKPSTTDKDTSRKVETQTATKSNGGISNPQSASRNSNKQGTSKEEVYKNEKDDGIYFENEHTSHGYDFDEFDEEMIEKDSFDDSTYSTDYDNEISRDHRDDIDYSPFEDLVDEPCAEDCDKTEYSTNYGNVTSNNYDQPADNVEYDSSRHFFDEFDSENDFDDLYDADMEARKDHKVHLHKSRCEHHFHADDDDFDDDFR